jgi:hypothetical protein
MVLSRRERYIVIGTLVALGLLVLDRLVFSPLLESRSVTEAERANLAAKVSQSQALADRRGQMDSRWRAMVQAGMKEDPAEAESQIVNALSDWARESGLPPLSFPRLERQAEKRPLPEIVIQATGTGDMRGVARLLWRIQTAAIPIKVTEAQITARKEGADDLTFQLRLSTLHSPPPSSAAPAATARADASGGS